MVSSAASPLTAGNDGATLWQAWRAGKALNDEGFLK